MPLTVLSHQSTYRNSGTPEGKTLIHLDLDPST